MDMVSGWSKPIREKIIWKGLKYVGTWLWPELRWAVATRDIEKLTKEENKVAKGGLQKRKKIVLEFSIMTHCFDFPMSIHLDETCISCVS